MNANRNIILIFLFIITQHYSFSQCADTSKIYRFNYAGKKYEIVKELKTWAEAATCAKERGGRLVEINDSGEQKAIYDAITIGAQISKTYTTIANGGGIAYVWIGATDQKTEGNWIWDGENTNNGNLFWTGQGANGSGNGTPNNGLYHNWGGKSKGTPNEPDDFGNGQDHAAMALNGWPAGTTMLGSAGEWNDIIGTSQLYYVVEINQNTGLTLPSDEGASCHVFPNPCQDQLQISWPCQYIQIFDMQGRCAAEYRNTQSLDVSMLAEGTYVMTVFNNEKYSTSKITISR